MIGTEPAGAVEPAEAVDPAEKALGTVADVESPEHDGMALGAPLKRNDGMKKVSQSVKENWEREFRSRR